MHRPVASQIRYVWDRNTLDMQNDGIRILLSQGILITARNLLSLG